jgi:vancomycin resistance protein YoaR
MALKNCFMAEKAEKEKKLKEPKTRTVKKTAVSPKIKKEITAKEIPLLEERVKTSHLEEAKILMADAFDSYKKDLDPEKVQLFKKEIKKIFKSGAIFTLVILAAAAILLLPEVYFNKKIQANTFVGGIDVSSVTTEEAGKKLTLEINQYQKKPITFRLNQQKISLSPEELGVHYMTEKIISQLPVVNLATANTLQMANMMITKTIVPARYSYDEGEIIKKLEEKFELGSNRAKDAKIIYQDKNFIIEPETPGAKINEKTLFAALNDNLDGLRADTVTLNIVPETPRLNAVKLSEQKDRIIDSLKREITIGVDDKKIKFSPIDHLDWITFEEKTEVKITGVNSSLPIDGGNKYEQPGDKSSLKIVAGLKPVIIAEKVEPYLQENLLKDLEVPTSGVTITRKEDGSINIEGKGEDGKSVPRANLMAAINLALASTASYVPVPVRTEKAPVNISTDLQDLGIKGLLVTGHSAFYGSSGNRMHNINTGIAKFNGVIVKPNEEFSFNNILGEVDAKNGYVQEKVIKKNKAEMEYGGGICQVSTTLYRAALLGGFPITERNPHSWKVSYYGQSMGHGLDATIYIGVSDVKFINDSPAHILIQAYTEGAEAYFKIYGTSDGRTTVMDGPYGGGLSYKWYRTVKKNGEEIKETIISNYKPIPAPDPPKPKTPDAPTVAVDPPKPTL